jgi:DNA-binding transcriptional LysR family regulator
MEGAATEGLECFDYRSDRLAVVVPPGHPLAEGGTVRFDDVLDYDLVALESSSTMMNLLAEHAVNAGKGLKLRVQVRGFEVVCKFVQAGLGIGILPYQAASAMSQSMGLQVRALAEPWADRRMLACIKKDRPRSVSLNLLLDLLTASQPG